MERPHPTDVGLEILNCVYDRMKIDPQWTQWHDRGFTWWGCDRAQHVWADKPIESQGFKVSRLHARTDILDGFMESDDHLSALGDVLGSVALSGFIRSNTDRSRILLASSVFVHQETLEQAKLWFSLSVAMQFSQSIAVTNHLVSALDGAKPATSDHPLSGPRKHIDDMAGAASSLPASNQTSMYQGSEMKQYVTEINGPPCILVNGDETSISAEFPYPNFTSLIQVMTEEEHPIAGRGLWILLKFPVGGEDPTTVDAALNLNEYELNEWTGIPFLGSWCPTETGLTFISFYPNLMRRPNSIAALVTPHILRAKRINEDLDDYKWEEHFEEAFEQKMQRVSGRTKPFFTDDNLITKLSQDDFMGRKGTVN